MCKGKTNTCLVFFPFFLHLSLSPKKIEEAKNLTTVEEWSVQNMLKSQCSRKWGNRLLYALISHSHLPIDLKYLKKKKLELFWAKKINVVESGGITIHHSESRILNTGQNILSSKNLNAVGSGGIVLQAPTLTDSRLAIDAKISAIGTTLKTI